MIGFISKENKTEKIICKVFMAIILIGFLFILITPVICEAMISYDAYNYVVTSGEKRIIAWTPSPVSEQVDGYEITVTRMETDKIIGTWRTSKTEFAIIFKTLGHNFIMVRAYKTVNGVRQYSGFASSLDPAVGLVDGKPRAWALIVPSSY